MVIGAEFLYGWKSFLRASTGGSHQTVTYICLLVAHTHAVTYGTSLMHSFFTDARESNITPSALADLTPVPVPMALKAVLKMCI